MRVRRLCETKLSAKNLFKAINEHVISVINYHIGVLKLEPEKFVKLDDSIRKILMEFKIHLQPADKERLYLPREMLGRGLSNIEHKSENMLLDLKNTLEKSKLISQRRKAILMIECNTKTHLSLIDSYLKTKYSIEGSIAKQELHGAQILNNQN